MSFGTNLIRIREDNGVSRKELAEKLGLPYTTLRNYETDQREPNYNLLIRIAELFSVSVDALLGAHIQEKKADFLPQEAMKVARDYNGLDTHGKTVVKVLISEEHKRMEEEEARRRAKELFYDEADEFGEHSDPRIIPLYFTPAAAGFASPAFGEDFEYVNVGGDVPRQADFAVRIDGDSMEPYIMDESVVYVSREPLENGDVGIFFVDGDMLCKQYYKDESGNIHLLSLNRGRADADRFVHAKGDYTFTCYGRVILPDRPKVALT